MKEILALWMARNREYYRDKGSLFWSFVATPFIVIVLAIAFSSESQEVFRAGLLITNSSAQTNIFTEEPAIQLIEYTDAQEALR
ncbi:MAG: hypothetical protein V7722_03270, partial [Porticoccus sp.]